MSGKSLRIGDFTVQLAEPPAKKPFTSGRKKGGGKYAELFDSLYRAFPDMWTKVASAVSVNHQTMFNAPAKNYNKDHSDRVVEVTTRTVESIVIDGKKVRAIDVYVKVSPKSE